TSTNGACHCVPKKKFTETTCWLFSANAKSVKKMAALSSHIRYFTWRPQSSSGDCSQRPGSTSLFRTRNQHFLGAGIHRFAQGLAWLEVGHAFFGNCHAFAGTRIASHARWAPVDGETAKAANFDPVPTHQRVAHGVKNRLDGIFG